MKTQPLWDTVPFPLLRQTPSPRGSPALGGWGRTENPNPVGRSLSWENSTGRQSLPSRKAGRPGSRGVFAGGWGGSGKETQRPLTFLSFGTRALLSQARPRRRRPPSLGPQAVLRPPPSGHPGHVLLCPRDPPPNTGTYTYLRPCCRSPEGYVGGCPPGSTQLGSWGRKGGEEG